MAVLGREAAPQTRRQWVCRVCGFIYDEAEGDPDGGIPPGTPFAHIPEDWRCPECGVAKADFTLLPVW
jgi:rubredoxin---NAD+ reductase